MSGNSTLTESGARAGLIPRAPVRSLVDRGVPASGFRMLARSAVATVVTVMIVGVASAGDRYENARFAYVVEVPAGFSKIAEADNSDGGAARSPQGAAELAVWGANLLDETFADDVRSRIASDASDGWAVSYKNVRRGRASWSGSKGERIAYSRAITACAGQAAYFRLEYDRAAAKSFDPIVTRLTGSLKATGRCM